MCEVGNSGDVHVSTTENLEEVKEALSASESAVFGPYTQEEAFYFAVHEVNDNKGFDFDREWVYREFNDPADIEYFYSDEKWQEIDPQPQINESKTNKNMKKNAVKLNESTLNKVIANSIKKILKEELSEIADSSGYYQILDYLHDISGTEQGARIMKAIYDDGYASEDMAFDMLHSSFPSVKRSAVEAAINDFRRETQDKYDGRFIAERKIARGKQISEGTLRKMIAESVRKVLKEEIGTDIDSEFGGKAEYSPFSSYGDIVSIKVPTSDSGLRSNVVKFMQQQGYQLYNTGQLDGGAKCILDFRKGGLNEDAYDFLEDRDFKWNNGYDSYVLVDDSCDAVIQNYASAEGYDAKADAINDAKKKARETRGGSFSVFGCANGMYDDNSLVYCTSNDRNSWKF